MQRPSSSGRRTADSWIMRGSRHSKAVEQVPLLSAELTFAISLMYIFKSTCFKVSLARDHFPVKAYEMVFFFFLQRQQPQEPRVSRIANIPSSAADAKICLLKIKCCLRGDFSENMSGSCVTGAGESKVVNPWVLIVTGKLEELLIDSLES